LGVCQAEAENLVTDFAQLVTGKLQRMARKITFNKPDGLCDNASVTRSKNRDRCLP
jgi:hypothetical protein